MKIINIKYIALLVAFIGFTACNDPEDVTLIEEEVVAELPALSSGSADFSNYVAIGASFTAGYTDGALFKAAQENSFPNILSKQFAKVGGGAFTQPLMNDNFGGLAANGARIAEPRLVFGGAGPVPLESLIGPVTVTTDLTANPTGPFNNMGIPGAKSFHLLDLGIPGSGYGDIMGLGVYANPYFIRMASSPSASVLGDVMAQNPSFFTLSEIAGNDVLSYALSGGTGVDQTGNINPATYGINDITDPNVFAQAFNATVTTLTSNGANGVIANIPYITDLPHFTTVPHNPLDPSNPDFGPQIPLLNSIFGALNQIFAQVDPSRIILFSETEASAVVIKDESLADISAIISGGLLSNLPAFEAFIGQFNLPPQAAPGVAGLLGLVYGQARQATEDDLFVLPSSNVIGEVNTDTFAQLSSPPFSLPPALAGQFSVEGITLPLEDKWVLLPSEQLEIKTATDAFNSTIADAATTNGLAFVDFKSILEQASTTGIPTGNYTLTTNLVTGGLVSLDGIHLTARGYAVMANEFMKAIDATYGSNFEESGNFVDAGNYPTNFSPTLQ
ncbi:SGNH/GDSL hydrolase family protein [Maribacter arenosus]|uniref:G-D-S-L family lipolytic protein n=1 Tax=Maribacter arenosus TaxID=1854708 RepID=A0ABR7VCU0_9FLAO|nr:G-D-S-L family lipolytic protein [Maribacter arenosus]MBD0851456.1 G-D-S-L family lipolytic protein [Maribacter arenosus]